MALDYLDVRALHQGAVTLSIAGFFARGLGALQDAAWVRSRAARTLPHVVDTALLASALTMLAMLRLSPLEAPWVMAKIAGLLAYIALGTVAMKPGRPRNVRVAAWLGALVVAGWIVSVAITKSPWGFLGALGGA